jgi:3-oxoisoapionate decarboxylase
MQWEQIEMKLGISSYTYPWAIGLPDAIPTHPLTPVQLLEKARELGVGIVQFAPNMPLDKLPERELNEVVKLSHTWQIDLEIGTVGIEQERLRDQIRFAKHIGAILLKIRPERPDGRLPMRTEIANSLHAILGELAGGEIRLAIDNSRIAAQDLNELLESIDSPCLGAGLDTANPLAIPEGWQISVRVLAHRTLSLHIKDFYVQPAAHGMGLSVEGCPVGNGQLNIPWLVESFAALRIDPSAILESWTPDQGTLQETIALEDQWAKKGVMYLRRFISD